MTKASEGTVTVIDGYEAEPEEVAAIIAAEIDDEDRADPTLLYLRATKLQVLLTAVCRELGKVRGQAAVQLNADMSYDEIAEHLGISKGRVQQLVTGARS